MVTVSGASEQPCTGAARTIRTDRCPLCSGDSKLGVPLHASTWKAGKTMSTMAAQPEAPLEGLGATARGGVRENGRSMHRSRWLTRHHSSTVNMVTRWNVQLQRAAILAARLAQNGHSSSAQTGQGVPVQVASRSCKDPTHPPAADSRQHRGRQRTRSLQQRTEGREMALRWRWEARWAMYQQVAGAAKADTQLQTKNDRLGLSAPRLSQYRGVVMVSAQQ